MKLKVEHRGSDRAAPEPDVRLPIGLVVKSQEVVHSLQTEEAEVRRL